MSIGKLAGGIVAGVGSALAGKAQQEQDDLQAGQVHVQAMQRARAIRYMAKQAIAGARADYSAAGVDVNSGSPLIAQQAISRNSEVDALNALASGAANERSLFASGRAANTAGYIKGVASVLGSMGGDG